MRKMIALTALVLGLALFVATGALAQGSPSPRPTATLTVATSPTPTASVVLTPSILPTDTLTVTATLVPTPTVTVQATVTPTQVTTTTKTILSEQNERVELVVYNQNQALVREYRTLQLAAGENEVRYANVPAQIIPASLRLFSLTDPAGTLLLEQTYQYDTADSDTILAKYVNQEITLKTRDGSAYTGTLLSSSNDIVLATTRGIVIVKADQIQEYTLPLPAEGLVTRPSLLWRLDADKAGENQVRVTYLTGGINWSADYAAVLSTDETTLSLDSWVTLVNQSGASYEDATLKLVAGTLNVATSASRYALSSSSAYKSAEQVTQSSLMDYYVYSVERPITIQDQQSKQIAFINTPEVAAQKVYVYDASPAYTLSTGETNVDPSFGVQSDTAVQVQLEFSNTLASGLGMPLPAGTVRVYTEDEEGNLAWVGTDSIAHTPVNEALSLTLGEAFDVLAERTQTKFQQLAENSIEETTEITLRNQKDEDIVVRVIEYLFRAEDAEVLSSTQNYTQLDAHTIQFEVQVLAGGKVTLEYSTRYRW